MTQTTNPPMSCGGSESTSGVRAACGWHGVRCAVSILLLGVASLVGGCGDKAAPTSSSRGPVLARPPERSGGKQIPVSNTDPCAMRLHDLCAPLLLYYGMNHSLPPRLEDLRQVTGFAEDVVLTCPT